MSISTDALAEIESVDVLTLSGDDDRIAFWINAYNATVNAYLGDHPVRGNLLLHIRLFNRAKCTVGEHSYSANQIEHGLLRGNRRPPLALRPILRPGDPRLAAAPARVDPRLHFALNCGARSCPPIRSYEACDLEEQLELATRSYLEQESAVDPEAGRIELPYLMRLYRSDFGSKAEQLEFAAARLSGLSDWSGAERENASISYRRFDWTAI